MYKWYIFSSEDEEILGPFNDEVEARVHADDEWTEETQVAIFRMDNNTLSFYGWHYTTGEDE